MAGLIPQSFIDNLLSRTDIVDVVDQRVPLKKTGNTTLLVVPSIRRKHLPLALTKNGNFIIVSAAVQEATRSDL